MGSSGQRETATLAGGCFWCLEAVFELRAGVEAVESGYTGGHLVDPTYRQVSTGTTGHAEAVRLTFDPSVVTFRELLDIFFTIHDPTTLNRQGADVGPHYRSAIFYHSPEQKAIAEEVIAELQSERYPGTPIVTEVVPAGPFYLAEPEHREYFRRNPQAPYCQVVIAPKVARFRAGSAE
jgi:peptide-methionine (S)-S-oxide reductase